MSDPSFDCVSCGACCFSRNLRYLQLLPWDASRSLPPESLFTEGGNTYVDFSCGHCVHLDLSNGKAACQVYENRPEACRAFRAGSFECVKARRTNGIMGEKAASVLNAPA
ncbi:YkgJ family cysteine cluster protein [Hyphomonas sp.]|uniref:YkgJ family cysteine cluster protein n=1 Tax=Hyphomonas sp. TaxID=87 RepID=UPI0035289FBF